MSKKKNTLTDLEEFLKMQASALVTPAPIAEQPKAPAPTPVAKVSEVREAPRENKETNFADELHTLASQNKSAFYDLLIRTTEALPNRSKDDTLLINTLLYLKGGDRWKEVVKEYWKKRG